MCAPLSGNPTGRRGRRVPLLLAGAFFTGGALCLADLSRDTSVLLLLLAYLLLGIGFGFANAPITNTGLSGLPPVYAPHLRVAAHERKSHRSAAG
jgi:MFS family permease